MLLITEMRPYSGQREFQAPKISGGEISKWQKFRSEKFPLAEFSGGEFSLSEII